MRQASLLVRRRDDSRSPRPPWRPFAKFLAAGATRIWRSHRPIDQVTAGGRAGIVGAMTLEIYWGSGSPFAWRVLLAAELKHIPYESKLLEFSKGDLKAPEFLALNPRGKVPVVRDGDLVLAESIAILAYLDRKFPDPPLFGRSAEDAGRIWTLISEFDSYVREPLNAAFRWAFGDKPRGQEVDDALAKIGPELAKVDARLARSAWLGGDAISAADVAWFPWMRMIVRVGVRSEARTRELGLHTFLEAHPNVAAWIARIEALPGYDRTYPPHWR
jgi:glutathione S-transferase